MRPGASQQGAWNMATTQVSPSATRTRVRSALDALMMIGMFGAAVDFSVPLIRGLAVGHIFLPALIFVVADLVGIAVVATRWRWSMVVAVIVGVASLFIDVGTPFGRYTLAHPRDYYEFSSFAFHTAVNLMVVSAAVVKLAQAARHQAPHTPRGLTIALTGLAGILIGALLVGVTAQFAGAGAAAAPQAGTEIVHLETTSFVPNIVALHAGDKLTLIDDVPVGHTLTNGIWSADNRPVPGVEPGAVILNNVQLNNNTVTVGPFTTPGTYHIYCTVHPGMTLTIIVQ
jgi:plastocyanin